MLSLGRRLDSARYEFLSLLSPGVVLMGCFGAKRGLFLLVLFLSMSAIMSGPGFFCAFMADIAKIFCPNAKVLFA